MKIDVNFTCEIPCGIDEEFITEWIEYRLGLDCVISNNNPLISEELEAIDVDYSVVDE